MNPNLCSSRTCSGEPAVTEPLPLCSGCATAVVHSVANLAFANQPNQRNRRSSVESEIGELVRLIDSEGWKAVGLNRAIKVLGAPKATAAKRLAAARRQYAAELANRTR